MQAAALVLSLAVGVAHALVVDIRTTSPGPLPVAVFSAAGLDNRASPTVYVLTDSYDVFW